MLSRVVGRMVPAASSADVVRGWSVGGGERPAEAGEFASGGDRDERAALAALGVEASPGAVQPLLRIVKT